LIEKAGRGDVIKLIAAYEASLFNNAQIHSTNRYESRRHNAFAAFGSSKLRAAAAASATALVSTQLSPGQSTDGAVFYPNQGKPFGTGKLIISMAGETFVFPLEDTRDSANPRSDHQRPRVIQSNFSTQLGE